MNVRHISRKTFEFDLGPIFTDQLKHWISILSSSSFCQFKIDLSPMFTEQLKHWHSARCFFFFFLLLLFLNSKLKNKFNSKLISAQCLLSNWSIGSVVNSRTVWTINKFIQGWLELNAIKIKQRSGKKNFSEYSPQSYRVQGCTWRLCIENRFISIFIVERFCTGCVTQNKNCKAMQWIKSPFPIPTLHSLFSSFLPNLDKFAASPRGAKACLIKKSTSSSLGILHFPVHSFAQIYQASKSVMWVAQSVYCLVFYHFFWHI